MQPSPAVPGYSLSPPAEADALAALQRVFGAERGAERWNEACRAARVTPGRVSAADLARVVEALAAQGGATAVVARSMEIRLRTYTRLAANALTAGAPR
jgi:hypothetical protein